MCGDLDVITAALGAPSDCLEEKILRDPLKSNHPVFVSRFLLSCEGGEGVPASSLLLLSPSRQQ